MMPKHQMTRTALYRFCEARSLNYANASVVSLMWIESWIKNQIDADPLHKLHGYFTLKAREKFKLVCLIPPSSGPAQAIAICSVTVSYCSTLLIGSLLLDMLRSIDDGEAKAARALCSYLQKCRHQERGRSSFI